MVNGGRYLRSKVGITEVVIIAGHALLRVSSRYCDQWLNMPIGCKLASQNMRNYLRMREIGMSSKLVLLKHGLSGNLTKRYNVQLSWSLSGPG